MLFTYKKQFSKLLQQYFTDLDGSQILSMIEMVPENIEGDLGFPCFRFAQLFKKSPQQIAEEAVEMIKGQAKIITVGPYINFLIPTQMLSAQLFEKILTKKEQFGAGDNKNRSVLIEGRQPNTHKAFHIGHIRNALVPEALARIMEFAGFTVYRCAYMGDVGAHVAKWIWYFINFYQGTIPTQDVTKRSGELYAAATRKIDENSDRYKAEINDIHKRLEDQDPELIQIRKETRERCLQDMKKIFAELQCNIGKLYLESDVEQPGIKKVKEMEEQGIAEYSEGAIIMNLEQYKLGIFVLLKSNGASLYSTKDIALAYQKQQDFDVNESIYVVATEQIHHFNQLFKTLKLDGYKGMKLRHLAYGMVDLVGEKMSSRKGNVVLYEELRDRLLSQAQELVAKRNLSDDKKDAVAHAVAFGALKFALLHPDTTKKILFDPKTSLSFEGETGPYIQYTYARCCSILQKAGISKEIEGKEAIRQSVEGQKIHTLLLLLAQFPDIVAKAANEYKPNYIAQYVFDVAQTFNSFYAHHQIITDNKNLTIFRVRMVMCVQQVLANAMRLLGIDTVPQM